MKDNHPLAVNYIKNCPLPPNPFFMLKQTDDFDQLKPFTYNNIFICPCW